MRADGGQVLIQLCGVRFHEDGRLCGDGQLGNECVSCSMGWKVRLLRAT